MVYFPATLSLNKRQAKEIEVAVVKMLRYSLVATRIDRIRNKYIKEPAHVSCFGDKVKESRADLEVDKIWICMDLVRANISKLV